MKKMNLGILGMGTVASGLISLNNIFDVKKVLVKDIDKKRNVKLSSDVYTTDAYEIINNKDIDIVVELIGGIYPAYDYVKAALNNKKHVVTANKALIATHGNELEELAVKNNVKLLYEASVAGGIPVINTISENLRAYEIDEIVGILNGTTNFILTQMYDNGLEYDAAIKKAQQLGFAEADPSSDVEGYDAMYKVSILSNILFKQKINLDNITREGITKISKEDICYAKENGYSIRLLAKAVKKENELELCVHPAFIPANHTLANVKNEFNAVYLKGDAVGELMLYGKGAGSLPTGSAVLADIMSIASDSKLNYNDNKNNQNLIMVKKACNAYYIRLVVTENYNLLGQVAAVFSKNNVEINSLLKKYGNNNDELGLIILTKKVDRKFLDMALDEAKELKLVENIGSIIMIENF